MEVIKSMQDHLDQDLEDVGGDDIADIPPAVEPKRLAEGFQD